MQPVAITGVTGFIGRHVARELTNRGLAWRGLVRNAAKSGRLGLTQGEIAEGTLEDEAALDRLCQRAEAVIHCGGSIAGFGRRDFFLTNVAGTERLARAARRQGVKRLVHVSSLAAREPGLSAYAESKAESETVLRREAQGMAWATVRPPAVYGPGDEATIPLIRALTWPMALVPGHRSGRLSLIHASDLAKALVHLAVNDPSTGKVYEIDDGKPQGYTFPEMAAIAASVTGVRARVVFVPRSMLIVPAWAALISGWARRRASVFAPGKLGELYHRDWVVNPNLSHLPGWRPRIDFSTGFAETLKWYREHGWLPEGHMRAGSVRAKQRGPL
jgi:nucleoside-diphosphate-sugar epimerase